MEERRFCITGILRKRSRAPISVLHAPLCRRPGGVDVRFEKFENKLEEKTGLRSQFESLRKRQLTLEVDLTYLGRSFS